MVGLTRAIFKNGSFICLYKGWGFTINCLHGGKGFCIYMGNIFIWQQAWFGKTNEVSWWVGKYRFAFPFLNKHYYPVDGWKKMSEVDYKK